MSPSGDLLRVEREQICDHSAVRRHLAILSIMRIAAILGVKDERELLPDCIGQLRRIGVDHIEAIDAGSTDGSIEWLAAREREGELGLHHFSDQDPDADGWDRLNVDLARSTGADWVLFLDADEFWIPASGHLRDCAGFAQADVLQVHRYNVPLGPGGLLTIDGASPRGAEGLQLIVAPVPDFRARLDGDDPMPWIRGVPMPKVATRAEFLANIDYGGHDVHTPDGAEVRRVWAKDLVIAHLPFTTRARFARKVDNIRRVFAVHDAYFGEHLAWHWRRWIALDGAHSVDAEFARQAFDAATLARLRAEGAIRDAVDWFADRDTEPA
jgi:glycosyltransferase involved in cell wall biosynthesis